MFHVFSSIPDITVMSTAKELPHEKAEWKGYTLDELRYMRAYTAARIEISRGRLKRNFTGLKKANPVKSGGMLGKVLGTLSYLDIALVTFRLGSKAFKVMRWFKRK